MSSFKEELINTTSRLITSIQLTIVLDKGILTPTLEYKLYIVFWNRITFEVKIKWNVPD